MVRPTRTSSHRRSAMVAFASMLRAVAGPARPRGSAGERRRARPALRSARGPAPPRATGISQGAIPAPVVLFDTDFVGPEGSHDKRLAQEKGVILAWAHSVSEGAAAELTVRPETAVASDRRPIRFAHASAEVAAILRVAPFNASARPTD